MAEQDYNNLKSEESGAMNGVATVESMMTVLWERTADRLTTEELEWFAGSSEYARMQARQLSKVIESVGCLVCSDAKTKTGAGNFQSGNDVSTLLFSIAHSVDTIAGMMDVSDSAQHRLSNPDLYLQLRAHRKQYEPETIRDGRGSLGA